MENKTRYITVKEVSEYLKVSLKTAYRLVEQGKIRSIRFGGAIRCLYSDVENCGKYGTDFSPNQVKTNNYQNDRRKSPRINTDFVCHYSIDLNWSKDTVTSGTVLNLGPEGVFVATLNCHSERSEESQNIKVDDPIIIKFSLPFKEEKREEINVTGRVLRKQENGFAVKFREIDEKLKDDIKEYIG